MDRFAPAVTRRRVGRSFAAILVCLFIALRGSPARAQATSDCFPDRIVSFVPGSVSSPPAFNTWQPGIVLGPPGSATPTTGSLAVMSVGHGGTITLEFTDNEIVDGPGPDLIVFENPFFCTSVPGSDADPYSVFAEPGIVEVSEDGVNFTRFPFDASALAQVTSLCTDKALLGRLIGLFGITPNFTGDCDGLSGDAERFFYLTDPARPDTDGDGVPDGIEAASCRDPASASAAPFFIPVLDLEVAEASPTVVRWNFLGSGITYDVIRGGVSALHAVGGLVDLGVVTCIENDSTDLTTRGLADASFPPSGQAFFYLVRQNPPGSGLGYGFSTAHDTRHPATGDCL